MRGMGKGARILSPLGSEGGRPGSFRNPGMLSDMTGIVARRRVLQSVFGWVLISGTGCGTILYPERKGQSAGRLDPKVVILDGVGLLLFFIPGVIAFAVDFSNGTIYLPPESESAADSTERDWRAFDIEGERITVAAIEEAVRRHSGEKISLEPGGYRLGRLSSVKELRGLETEEAILAANLLEESGDLLRCQSE